MLQEKLIEAITELAKVVAELDAAVAKATSVRAGDEVKDTVTIKDAQDARTAVAQALSVLKEFYAKAAGATSFVQEPEIFGEPYKGMGVVNGGVVGTTEVSSRPLLALSLRQMPLRQKYTSSMMSS